MAYIGRNPAIGTQKVLDSLESQFNGTLTTFDLRYLGNTIYPPIASALIVSLGGVLQEPGVAYTVASDTITFASAPPTGADCWILLYTEFGGAAGATANLTVSNNLTIGNELHGPANFVIDPATIGDNTGTVEIKGNLTVQGTQTTVNSTTVDLDHLSLGDNEIANFGDGNDLQIYHNGSNSYIQENGQGGLRLVGNQVSIRNNAENMAVFNTNADVKLYYDNSLKFQTTNTGIDVTGLTDTDTLNVSSTSTFNGQINIPDNTKIMLGASNDLQILHIPGTGNSIQGTSPIYLQTTSEIHLREYGGSEIFAKFIKNGAVELYYDNSKNFETTSTGVTVTGALEVSAATNITVGGTALPSLTGLLGGSLDGTLGTVTMAYLPSAPSSPVQGQFYFNSLNQKAQIYTGSSFVDLVPSGGGGGGGGGGSSTDANATFRKYTYSISSTTNSVSGSSDLVTSAGSFITGRKYTIKTVGTTDFTAIGASANTVGVVFDATGAGSGSGDAFDTLVYSTGGDQNVEVYVNGVKSVEGSSNDYVATSGTSVNFVANLNSGDVVDIQVYELLTNDAYVLASGGTFTGNVGINTSTINNRLHIHSNANEQGILLTQDGDNYSSIVADSDRSVADRFILEILAKWNGTKAAQITLETGNDTTNKDDGRIKFWTASSGGSLNAAMHIDPSGNIGIGLPNESDEATEKLDVNGNIQIADKIIHRGDANTAIRFPANDTIRLSTSGSSRLNVSPNGYILIGSNSEPSGGDAHAQNAKLFIQGRIGNTADSGRINLQRGSAASDGSSIGSISFTDVSNNAYGRIETFADAATGSNDFPGRIVFSTTNDGASTPTEKLRITSTGNIGINNIDPGASLDIGGNTDGNIQAILTRGFDANFQLQFRNETSSNDAHTVTGKFGLFRNNVDIVGMRFLRGSGTGAGSLDFTTGGVEKVRIDSNGNVGVGTDNPTEKLHVEGSIYFNNNAIISNYGPNGTEGSNVDHIWHNDAAEFGTGGSWVFNSDATYKNNSGGSWSNIKVGHVFVDNGSLGTSAGDIQDLARFYANNGNGTSLRVQAKRKLAGTNWTTASMKIFCNTDVTEQGYIEFNPHTSTAGDGNYDVAIGSSNAGEIIRFANSGHVGINTANPGNGLGAVGTSISVYNGSGARLGLWGNGSRWWYMHGEDTNAFQIGARTSSNTVDTDYLTISTNGNVGFGIANPTCKIDTTGHMEINGSAIGGILTANVADDAYVDVTPPIKGGHFVITPFSTYDTYPQPIGGGMVYFDVGNSRLLAVVVDTDQVRTGGVAKLISGGAVISSSATDFTDNAVTITTPSQGTLRIFNRTGTSRKFKIVFL
ncbi:virion structural protein [Cyanophage S-TIM54]|nr:virion structural protein [Cyanophage S-TIM54]